MNLNRTLTSFCLVLLMTLCHAQNTRNIDSSRPPMPQYQAFKKEKKGLFAFLTKNNSRQLKTAEEESAAFRTRIQKVNREKIKKQKKMDKMERKKDGYFGHKRPPKKRPPGKQKFCKVCKIKH
ncbi:MAG: hypothetical protein AAGI25_17870 [Bacteroidota bacterium]